MAASEGELAEAADRARQNPGDVVARVQFGRLLYEASRLDEAEHEFRAAAELAPQNVEAIAALGSVLGLLGRYLEAESCLRNAVELAPTWPDLHCRLAAMRFERGYVEDAAEVLEHALTVHPGHVPARRLRALVLEALARWEEAEEQLRVAAEQAPNDLQLLGELAGLLSRRGKRDEALRWFARSLSATGRAPDHMAQETPDNRTAETATTTQKPRRGRLGALRGRAHWPWRPAAASANGWQPSPPPPWLTAAYVDLTYDLACLLAGHPRKNIGPLSPENEGWLRALTRPLDQSGRSVAPDFGEEGDYTYGRPADDSTEPVGLVTYRDRSFFWRRDGSTVPLHQRIVLLTTTVDPVGQGFTSLDVAIKHGRTSGTPPSAQVLERRTYTPGTAEPEPAQPAGPGTPPEGQWPQCGTGPNCHGVALQPAGRCLAHLTPEERATYLDNLTGPLDGRGAAVTTALLDEVFRGGDRRQRLWTCWFDGATFESPAYFGEVNFGPSTSFDDAHFTADARFSGAIFAGPVSFAGATFGGTALFDKVRFAGAALFEEVRFQAEARYRNARFEGGATFFRASFEGECDLAGARFSRDLDSLFPKLLIGVANFAETRFAATRAFGPILVLDTLVLDGAWFDRPVAIDVSAEGLSCVRTHFQGAASIRARYADVLLEEADFADVAWVGTRAGAEEYERPLLRHREEAGEATRPDRARVISLRGAKVSTLTLSDVDLRACCFAGARGLDRLSLEDAEFARVPNGRARRIMLAEERTWRAVRAAGMNPPRVDTALDGRALVVGQNLAALDRGPLSAWRWLPRPPQCRPPGWVSDVLPVGAEQIAGTYRALRKAREDSKDEPGAADFYYGEMEMRRHARTTPRSERLIILAYWLVAGYGLRAWRALASFTLLATCIAAALTGWGFVRTHPPFGHSVVYALASLLSLPTSSAVAAPLTVTGEVLRIALRVSGPVLLGLALLSIRNRVKR